MLSFSQFLSVGVLILHELHVKLEPQRINIVEMRAKSVWRIKFVVLRPLFYPLDCWPKNTLKWALFWTYFFHFFRTKSSNNWWTQERNHSHQILHTNEVTPKAQSELENFLPLCKVTMEGSSWGWLTICTLWSYFVKNIFRKVPILACFLVKNPGGKKGGVKHRILCVKRILLSIPRFSSDLAIILHEVPQCTPNFFHQFDKHNLHEPNQPITDLIFRRSLPTPP